MTEVLTPTPREILFEEMFGYPMCLAESVLRLAAENLNFEQELKDYHADRLCELDRVLGDD